MPVKTTPKTKDAVRKRAEDFSYVSVKGNYEEEAKKLNLQVIDIPGITKNSFIPGAGQNKTVIKFAFDESKGSISEPIKIQGGYAVYFITEKNPKGYLKFEEIKENTVTPQLRLEKKLDILRQIVQDMRTKISGNDLNSLKQFDPNIIVQQVDSFSVTKPNPSIGSDFDFINPLFKLQNGQLSEPIRTKKGYFIIHMLNVTPFDQQKFNTDKNLIRTGLIETKKQEITTQWISDLKERAKIIDNRDKFFR